MMQRITNRLLIATSLVVALACTGADGIAGPVGPAGRDGVDGMDAVVNYDSILATVAAGIPKLVTVEVAKLPPPRTDTLRIETRIETTTHHVDTVRVEAVFPSVVEGDLRVHGRICVFNEVPLGQCETSSQLELHGRGATIGLFSNLDGAQSQSPEIHAGYLSLDPDGGLGFTNNPSWWPHYDGRRGSGTLRFDSQSELSLSQRAPGDFRPGQDFVFRVNGDTGLNSINSYIPGVRIQFCQTPADKPYAYTSDCR
jgi:hypothetical protein